MPKTEIRETWEIMAFIQKHRGAALVGDILDVSETQVRRFSRNPKMNYSDPAAPNPFDWVIGLMDEIHDLGKEEILLAALNMMACRYGYFVSKDRHITPDKPTLELEILDDHPRLVEWHENMLQGKPLHLIRQGLETVNGENMQTYIKYMETQR